MRSSADGDQAGYPVVIFGGEHADVPLQAGSGEMIATVLVAERIPAILDLSLLRKTVMREWVADFLETLYRKNREALHVVIDEINLFAPQSTFAGSERALGAVEDVVMRGRIRGLGITTICQRAASLNKSILTQVETLILLRTTGRPDIAAIDDWIANHADPVQGREVKASLASLPTGTGWVWSPHFLDVLTKVTFRPSRTFDSSATPRAGQTPITPQRWANIDVTSLGEQVQQAIDTAHDADPKALQARITRLERELTAAHTATPTPTTPARAVDGHAQIASLRSAVADRDRRITELTEQLATVTAPTLPDTIGALAAVSTVLNQQRHQLDTLTRALRTTTPELQHQSLRPAPVPVPHRPGPAPQPARGAAAPTRAPIPGGGVELRSGARRMVEALARMAPLRVTKTQWGTVARLKTSGGTWSTYLSDIRRAGLLDENPAGYTLTAGAAVHRWWESLALKAVLLSVEIKPTLKPGFPRFDPDRIGKAVWRV